MFEYIWEIFTKPEITWSAIDRLVAIVVIFVGLAIATTIVYLIGLLIIKIKTRKK